MDIPRILFVQFIDLVATVYKVQPF